MSTNWYRWVDKNPVDSNCSSFGIKIWGFDGYVDIELDFFNCTPSPHIPFKRIERWVKSSRAFWASSIFCPSIRRFSTNFQSTIPAIYYCLVSVIFESKHLLFVFSYSSRSSNSVQVSILVRLISSYAESGSSKQNFARKTPCDSGTLKLSLRRATTFSASLDPFFIPVLLGERFLKLAISWR